MSSPLADLPPELLRHCFSFLDDDGRQAVLDVCTKWCATLLAAPELVPTATLACHFNTQDLLDAVKSVLSLGVKEEGYWRTEKQMLTAVAHLSPRTRRVRLEGWDHRGSLLLDAVSLLPSNLESLELKCWCHRGPLLPALARLKRLQHLEVTGNGTDVDWDVPAAAAVLPKLRMLRLDTHAPSPLATGMFIIPSSMCVDAPTWLAPAINLHTLELCTDVMMWTASLINLCRALPALRCLRLHLSYVAPTGGALAETMNMLNGLTRLTSICLSLSSMGRRRDSRVVQVWDDAAHNWVQPPPLSGLAPLAELWLHGAVKLPPDWRQLAGLQRLRINAELSRMQEWGQGPLTGLVALTELEPNTELPDVEVVASLPALTIARIKHATLEWKAKLLQLRPEVQLQRCTLG